ncbi:SH3 domain of the SH3b1 type [Legionella busanensis]|uniref:SH3 domain of the SH3b1 type n=1 Tax=Legionella busanensis TaxID=190655 RepID=A0A378JK92_9GAMM|nr:SH3 domain-containing C40 family peptidase [Legionella busanensis]STX50733.1 SH3 domain of the SH3b1 type [Legionella busanensis]
MIRLIKQCLIYCTIFSFSILQVYADSDVISLFPIEHYDQNISSWIKPSNPNYDKPLLSQNIQKQRMKQFYEHSFGEMSPWSATFVNQILQQTAPYNIKGYVKNLMDEFNNEGKDSNHIGYGENFRPYTSKWVTKIAQNIDLDQLDNLTYHSNNRGIAIDNLYARSLPTNDVYFYHHKIPGQGYPFDNLQQSALWAGTPVYILAQSKDGAWLLILTPEYIAWVNSKGIARTNNDFVTKWQAAAQNKMAAIIRPDTQLLNEKRQFLLTSYPGAVFPAHQDKNTLRLLVPVANTKRQALIKEATVTSKQAVIMPLVATPHNFTKVMTNLIGRPYGWGGLYFYNDCSAELKNLFVPFGIWLPRHSSQQIQMGRQVDLSLLPAKDRLDFLAAQGKPFMTIVYVGGHVVLYIGTLPNPNNPSVSMIMTYQNIWGLTPHLGDRRDVIGGSVLFPLLLAYPEDPNLISQAGKPYFQIAYLDEMPNLSTEFNKIDIKTLMTAKVKQY